MLTIRRAGARCKSLIITDRCGFICIKKSDLTVLLMVLVLATAVCLFCLLGCGQLICLVEKIRFKVCAMTVIALHTKKQYHFL